MAHPTPQTWAAQLLKQLGIHQTPGAVQAITGWARAEGGHWNNAAKFNPLNTTQGASGAQSVNSVGVKSYKDWQQGLDATVQTLRNGRYGSILSALQSGNPDAVSAAIGKTPWGTGGGLVQKTIASTPRVAGIHAFGAASGSPSKPTQGSSRSTTSSRTVGGVDNSSQRRALLGAFLSDDRADPLAYGMQFRALADVPGQKVTTTKTVSADSSDGSSATDSSTTASAFTKALQGRATAIDKQKLPYVYGGGHGATPSKPGTPLDCSSAVSKVLGINPRVSGALASWGAPGKGKNVTIYANPKHTFMEINGHFWGTSASNPGGGAGWIPRSQISADYLKGFTVRHPPGQ